MHRQRISDPTQRRAVAAKLVQIRRALRAGDAAFALDLAERVIEDWPALRAAYRLGVRAGRIHDREAAMRLVVAALLLWPEMDGWWIEFARLEADAGRHEVALSVARRLLQQAPSCFAAAEVAAACLSRLGDDDGAVALIVDAAQRRDTRQARLRAAAVCLHANRPYDGLGLIADLQPRPVLLEARLLAAASRWPEALEAFDDLLEGKARCAIADAEREAASVDRVRMLRRAGLADRLESLARRFDADAPESSAVGVELADALLAVGRFDLAHQLAFALRHRQGLGPRLDAIGLAAANALRRERAAAMWRGRLKPADGQWVASAELTASIGAMLIEPTSADLGDAESALLMELLDAAADVLDDAVAAHPDYADYRYHRAQCAAARGRLEAARRDLDAALARNPRYKDARRLREALNAPERSAA